MEITTLHRATVQYIYSDGVNHSDSSDITDEIDYALNSICNDFSDVHQNIDFRCQAHGFEIESENYEQLKEASEIFDAFLLRYVGRIEIIE